MRCMVGVAACACLIAASAASAAEPPEGNRFQAHATLVTAGPVIDGELNDPVWAEATPIGDLTQIAPVEGSAASKRTVVRLLTDGENLYVGVRCYDGDPGGIIARNMLRDGPLGSEDRVSFVLDTFDDQRNGFFFQTNALGLRGDGLIEETRILIEWDGIWNVRSRIDAQGWTAEFVIPYKTLSFESGADTWGFNISRGIRGTQERTRWADPHLNHRFSDMALAGRLHGMSESQQGLGIELIPSTSVRRIDDSRVLEDESRRRHYTRVTPSFDVRYKVTPSLTATGTVNTAFGQTPVDDVRLTCRGSRCSSRKSASSSYRTRASSILQG